MKINLIILFRCLISGSKRKYEEFEISGIESTIFCARESTSSKSTKNPCDSLILTGSSQCDLFANLGNSLDARCDSDELLRFLRDDGNNLEKANDETKNNVSENVISNNSINEHEEEEEECFTLEQFDKFVAKKFDDFHDNLLKPVNDEIVFNKEHMKNGVGSFSYLNLISSGRYTLKSYIENFILSKIPESYTDNYEKNVKRIDEAQGF